MVNLSKYDSMLQIYNSIYLQDYKCSFYYRGKAHDILQSSNSFIIISSRIKCSLYSVKKMIFLFNQQNPNFTTAFVCTAFSFILDLHSVFFFFFFAYILGGICILQHPHPISTEICFESFSCLLFSAPTIGLV